MNILVAIIILGVLILIHELGHFIVAKLCGVYVEKFSLGFGPRLIGKVYGETDYCISAFPLGGYVKMYGERSEDEKDPMKEGRAFSDKSAWKRALIIIAGPVANILLAIVIFWGLFMSGYPDYSAVLGDVKTGSPAEMAGLVKGDKIVSVDDKEVRSWSEFQTVIIEKPGEAVKVGLSDGRVVNITIATREAADIFGDKEIVGDIGVGLYVPAVVGKVHDGMPAKDAGLQVGDEIISINDFVVPTWNASAEYIRNRPGEELTFEVKRGTENLALVITPKKSEVQDETGSKKEVGLIGINPREGDVYVSYGFFDAMVLGFQKSYEFTKIVLQGFVKLIQRSVPADSLGGPIMIVQMAADSAQSGLTTLFTFMAIISVNLAVFNLLPIPVLDGGHLLIIAVEAITRRKLSEKIVGNFQMVGFAILMCLMVFAFYNDISRFFIK